VKPLAERKKTICKNCPLNLHNICSPSITGEVVVDFVYQGTLRKKGEIHKGCTCPLPAKHANPISKCPLGKFEHLYNA
jgi:hypothetical protein